MTFDQQSVSTFLLSIEFAGLLTKRTTHQFFYPYTKKFTEYIFQTNILIQILLFQAIEIRFNLKDFYSVRLISKNYEYASEVKRYISHFDTENFVYVHLGANIQY